jgi:exopolysaccharide biosynthesis polyprenyl glycosylphosphotransferase
MKSPAADTTAAGRFLGRAEREPRVAWLPLRPDTAWALARLVLDAAMLTAAGFAAVLGSSAAGVPEAPVEWLVLYGVLVAGTLGLRGMYRTRLSADLLEDLRGVLVATSVSAIAVLTLRELFTEPDDLSAQVLRPWMFATVYVAAGRAALHWSLTRARRQGESLRPTLIIGAGRVGRLTAERLLAEPERGLKPIGFLDKEPLEVDGLDSVPVLGASWDLDRVVAEHGIEQVIVTFSTAPNEVLLRLVRRCEQLGLAVSFVPRLFERMTLRLDVDYLGGIPLVTARAPNPYGWQFAVKHVLDRVIAAGLLLVLSPVLLASALVVWISMGRPIFFRQPRVGRDGHEFEILKFRTMSGDPRRRGEADAEWARAQLNGDAAVRDAVKPPDDDRSTRVGNILRGFSIDELPQLFNVVMGDMSLVGPRPERVHYVDLFERSVYRYGDRLRVKSGITGWAQVNGLRGQTSLADRVEWDNHYIENWSLWLDLKILLLTAFVVLRSSRQAG